MYRKCLTKHFLYGIINTENERKGEIDMMKVILIIGSLYIIRKCLKTLCKKLDNDEMPKTLFWTGVKRGYDEHKRVDK